MEAVAETTATTSGTAVPPGTAMPPGTAIRSLGEPSLAQLLGLREDELRDVSSRMRMLDYQKNRTVITEGEKTHSIYMIRSGRVKVFLNGTNGREISLNTLGPGEYFGEMALDEGPRSACVTTLEASQFFVIPVTVFRQFVARHPDFAMGLIRKLISRARGLLNSVGGLALLDVHGRVARLLLDLAVEQDGKLVVSASPTKQDIANRVGASREMVSRVFRDLAADGYIDVRKGCITIAKTLPDHKISSCRG